MLLAAALAGGCSREGAGEVPAGGASDGRRPLILVAADGLEWNLLLPWIEAGTLPHLGALAREGFAATLETLDVTLSPVIWTTVATGKPPQQHGILGFAYRGEDGAPHLFLSLHRKSKALWNLYDEAGLSTEVIGWWCTFPVEPIRGGMVAQTSTRSQVDISGGGVIWKGRYLEGVDHQVWPEERQERMDAHARAIVAEIEQGSDPATARFGPPPDPARRLPAQLYDALRSSYYADLLFRAAALDVLDGGAPPDALLLYLGSADVASHMFWRYLEPERYEDRPGAADVERFGGTIAAAYRFVDETVGELRRRLPDADFLLVSDHGFHAVGLKERFPDSRTGRSDSGNHQDAPPGVLLACGSGFRRQPLAPGATRADLKSAGGVADLLPTLLVRAGLPYAHDFAGRPLRNLLAPELLESQPIRSVPSHDDVEWRRRRADIQVRIPEFERRFEQALRSMDGPQLERLRQLGYPVPDDGAPGANHADPGTRDGGEDETPARQEGGGK